MAKVAVGFEPSRRAQQPVDLLHEMLVVQILAEVVDPGYEEVGALNNRSHQSQAQKGIDYNLDSQ